MRFGSLLLFLAACSPKADFERFCHAHEKAGVVDTDAPGDRAMKISRYLSENLTSKEAKTLLERLPTLPASAKHAALSAEAAQYGVTPCPLADVTWPSDAGP
jgi:hypothetical protein